VTGAGVFEKFQKALTPITLVFLAFTISLKLLPDGFLLDSTFDPALRSVVFFLSPITFVWPLTFAVFVFLAFVSRQDRKIAFRISIGIWILVLLVIAALFSIFIWGGSPTTYRGEYDS
jgi:hypothetical protein